MVLDITFFNTFSHKFLSEKDTFLGHSCIEGGGSCCRGGFFQVLFPVTCPEHLYVLLLGCLDTGGEDWKNLATYFQLWNRVGKGTLSPVLAVLQLVLFLDTSTLSTWWNRNHLALNTLHVVPLLRWAFVRLGIPTNIPFPDFQISNKFFKAWNKKRDPPKTMGKSSFCLCKCRIFGQHQNRDAVKKGTLCELEKYWGEYEAVSSSSKLCLNFEGDEWPFSF